MKPLFYSLLIAVAIGATSCKTTGSTTPTSTDPHAGQSEWECGTYNGHTTYTGPKGGCYWKASTGTKEYVDHSYCNCN